jgi:hypothetical protein
MHSWAKKAIFWYLKRTRVAVRFPFYGLFFFSTVVAICDGRVVAVGVGSRLQEEEGKKGRGKSISKFE